MSTTPGINRGRKFTQVLEGARKVFLRDGFEGASVDDIAREAGVSKATLYSYFPDKRLMFMEVFREELGRETRDGKALIDLDLPPKQVLPFVMQMLAAHLTSDFGVRTFRMAVGESERFPMLAPEYFYAGPDLLRCQLVSYFEKCVERGDLEIDDLDLAAMQFIELSSVDVHDRAIFLGPGSVDEARIQRVCKGAMKMFMATYGKDCEYAAEAAE